MRGACKVEFRPENDSENKNEVKKK